MLIRRMKPLEFPLEKMSELLGIIDVLEKNDDPPRPPCRAAGVHRARHRAAAEAAEA